MLSTIFYSTFDSPLGELLAVGDEDRLRGLFMQEGRTAISVLTDWQAAEEPFAELREQLGEYFAGQRRDFEVPLALEGSPFQRRVWRALQGIGYGETISYGELARRIGVPSASRAVGVANGHNPVSIIVPCHRVIGADGSLTGYGGGLERKRWLLELEAGVLSLGSAQSDEVEGVQIRSKSSRSNGTSQASVSRPSRTL
jgi:methylated-DNA-[protein]-cysteine S-methyltransferase